MPDAELYVLDTFMADLEGRNPGQPEFHQAVREVAESLVPYLNREENKVFRGARIFERMCEPDRVISFRVCWQDDDRCVRINRGYRVQFNNSIGPYKGGLRFHPSVTQSVLKFLGFEQTFKNALTTLPMGGGKGGANFDPKGRSDEEVMRFCQAFMSELYRHIGYKTDIPAGDIGVGAREVGYMFGMYKKLTGEFTGALTGKGLEFGGSLIRTEATGYGSTYFMEDMLHTKDEAIKGKTILVSGSGNVAQYTVEKCNHLGGKVVTLSDSSGFIHDPDGIDEEKLAFVKDLKNVRRGRIAEYTKKYGGTFHAKQRPWAVPCDLAFPSATQNEISADDALTLVKNGVLGVSEGANMPTEIEGVHVFQAARILYAPSKAANAGGVAVSGLEQSQNAMRISWSEEEVDRRLRDIMRDIHAQCVRHGKEADGHVCYVTGANRAAFNKVAAAMLACGVL
jgi:glutamate dehydrogenase (NADP+)